MSGWHLARATTGFEHIVRDGTPVFPLRDDRERVEFQAVARSYGARVDDSAPRMPRDGRSRRDRVVLAVGDASVRSGSLYAHLTGRRLVCVGRVPVPLDDDIDVIVLAHENFSYSLLDDLYQPSCPRVPGIISGRDETEMRTQVLWRSVALLAPVARPAPPVILDIHAGDRLSDAEDLTTKLLAVRTHSDGLDAPLGNGTLCTLKGLPIRTWPRPPSCVVNSYCHRLGRPLHEALASDDLRPPTDLSGRVVVLRTCWGVMANPSTVDARWAFAHRLLTSARVGSLVTPWEIAITQPDEMRPLLESLTRGEPLGMALAAANQAWAAAGTRMCLFGDPDLRMPIAAVEHASA